MSNTALSDLDSRKQRLERATTEGKDTALTRFALGKIVLAQGNSAEALVHFQRAVELKADYAAAWVQLGRAWTAKGNIQEATTSYRDGIEIAERVGEIQAALQMKVFLKRLEKRASRP